MAEEPRRLGPSPSLADLESRKASIRAGVEALTPEWAQELPIRPPLEDTKSPGKVERAQHLPGMQAMGAGLEALTSASPGKFLAAGAALTPAQILARLAKLAGKDDAAIKSAMKKVLQEVPEHLVYKGDLGGYSDWLNKLSKEDYLVHKTAGGKSIQFVKDLMEKDPKAAKAMDDLHQLVSDRVNPNEVRSLLEMRSNWPDERTRQANRMELGYTTPAYHGSTEFYGPKIKSNRFYATEAPELADLYAGVYPKGFQFPETIGKKYQGADYMIQNPPTGAQVVPLWLNTRGYKITNAEGRSWEDFNNRAISQAREEGKPGVTIRDVYDEPASTEYLGKPKTIHVTFDPSRIRSMFASFDPSKKDINDILAGIAGGTIAVPAALGGRNARQD